MSGSEDELAATEPSAPGGEALEPGTLVGRYLLETRIGEGGMGVVYRARDTELDRPVALKLVRPHHDAERLADRLRRESRLQARAAHPAVITVYDIGRDGERVFVAMELIDGVTLAGWLRQAPRSWREILDVFREAAEGIAAAHAAGLVHRDFKPDNVLVELRGDRVTRVLVTDFGVARALEAPDTPAGSGHTVDPRLTTTGVAIGTPAYMSPEQFQGDSADERSDVFSFCVALWEALYGERPYRGETLASISSAFLEEPRVPLPRAGHERVPRWIANVLRAGLAIDPVHRVASISITSAALDWRHRRRVRGGAGAAVACVGASAVAAVLALSGDDAPASRCDAVPSLELATVGDRVGAAMRSPLMTTHWRDATASYDRHYRRLRDIACAAPRFAEVEAMVVCADRAAAEASALLEGALRLEPSRRDDALRAVRITAPRECFTAAASSLLGVYGNEADVTAARLALLEADGAFDRDAEVGQQRLADARALVERSRVTLLRHELALLESSLVSESPEQSTFRTVARDAERDGHPLVAARAWVAQLSGLETDKDLFAYADSALHRAGNPPLTRAKWHGARAGMLTIAKRSREAAAELARARAVLAEVDASFDPRFAHMIATVHVRAGSYGAAEPLLARALAFVTASGVKRGRALLELQNGHAQVLGELGRVAEARKILEGLLAGVDPTQPLPDRELVRTIRLLAELRLFGGQIEEAVALLDHWRTAIDASLDRDSLHHAHLAHLEANALAHLGRLAEAERSARRALELRASKLGTSNGNTAETRILLGRILIELEQPAAAREHLERGIADLAAVAGDDFALVAQARYALASLLLELGKPEEARPLAERALAVYERSPALGAEERGSVRWTLAQTLGTKDLSRTRQLIEGALADWATNADGYRAEIRIARARLRGLRQTAENSGR